MCVSNMHTSMRKRKGRTNSSKAKNEVVNNRDEVIETDKMVAFLWWIE